MQPRRAVLLAAAAATLTLGAANPPLPPETPLIVDGTIVIDAGDFEGNLLRIPPEKRGEVRASYDRVATIVDNMYISRALAARARAAGLDKDLYVQRRVQQVQDGVLAEAYVRKLEAEAVPASLEQRARELYKADPAAYTTPEQVYIQHILIDYNGRTRAQARERAQKVHAEAKAGEDFLVLAGRYSDDKDRNRTTGDMGYSDPKAFVEPVRKAIASMKTKGEISPPIESDLGVHIVKFIERKPPELLKFEMVRDQIVAAEIQRIQKQRTEALVRDVRSSPSVTVHRENVEKLVIPVDPELLKKASETAAAAR